MLLALSSGLRRLRGLMLALAFLTSVGSAWAGKVEEWIAIHSAAIGGAESLNALKAMRATGYVLAGGTRVRFTMLAARPDKIRVETEQAGRTLVQASDGKQPPWEFDSGEWPPRYHEMAPAAAKLFTADAEFDDPLVAGTARGYTIEDGGSVKIDGRSLIRLIVTRRLAETFYLLLDPDTYLIVRRVEERKSPVGGTVAVVTRFEDYRPVDGVLIPHRVTLIVGGQVKQQTVIESIAPNPDLKPATFSRPKRSGA